ncbi:MAG: nuclear transport factor 2 family protein [Dongiaceae bacterium]
MRAVLAFLCAMIIFASPAFAADRDDILSVIQQSIDSYNKGDNAAAMPHFMKSPVLIDDLPPYHFQGANAISDWGKSYAADSRKNAITEPSMKLLQVKDVEVSGPHAYVAWPAIYSFKQDGKPIQQDCSITVVLQKVDGNWLVAAWVWTAQ